MTLDTMAINKLIRILFYILATILPVQGLLVKFLTNKLGFSQWLALWKEVLILIIIISLFGFICRLLWVKYKNLQPSGVIMYVFKNTKLLLVLFFLNVVIILNSFVFNSTDLKVFFYGYRFEIFWLILFVLIATWLNLTAENNLLLGIKKNEFINNLKIAVFLGFSLCSVVSLFSIAFTENKVFEWFDSASKVATQNSLLFQSRPCTEADYGSEICRLSGGFSSPNHFAGYLLLVLPIFIVTWIGYYQKWRLYITENTLNKKVFKFEKRNPILPLLLISLAILLNAIFTALTISRFAWLGLLVFIGLLIIYFGHYLKLYNLFLAKILIGILFFIPAFIGILAINIDPEITSKNLPVALAKPSSTTGHYRQTTAGIEVLNTSGRYLQGFGLGASGSVATSVYQDLDQNPIVKNYAEIAYKNGLSRDRITIVENWYLSVFLNGGLFYTFLYLVIVFYPISRFYNFFKGKHFGIKELRYLLFVSGFFAILIGNLFLHIWENQTITIHWSLLFILMQERYNLTEK